MRLVVAVLAAAFACSEASAHDWFTQKRDPVFGWGCCGGHDCKVFKPDGKNITAEKDGYRIRMSLKEVQSINPMATLPIDGIVTWDRVQPSETNEWAICLMESNRGPRTAGVFCLFEPPNM